MPRKVCQLDLGEFPAPLEEIAPIAEVKYADNIHVQSYGILLHVEILARLLRSAMSQLWRSASLHISETVLNAERTLRKAGHDLAVRMLCLTARRAHQPTQPRRYCL